MRSTQLAIGVNKAPRRFGAYELIGRIGYGGMGAVYLARYQGEAGVARLFAVKIMHEHLADDERALAMLRDEARLNALVHHPNVVDIIGLQRHSGRYYLIMEYVEGCTLHQILRSQPRPRPPERVVPIVLDVLGGLHAAHAATDHDGNALELVHRDVSSENVLIGVDGHARLADFGIAKAARRTTETRPGVRKGKYAYMAPEQVMGEAVDRRTDLFAAGIILYNALTGTRLFYGASDPDTLHNILHQPVSPPSEVGLRPPVAFDEVCMRALEREPGRRFSSAAEMASALRGAAVKSGIHGSHADVAGWVEEIYGEKLSKRRAAIREALAEKRARESRAESRGDDLTGPTEISTGPTVRVDPGELPATPWLATPLPDASQRSSLGSGSAPPLETPDPAGLPRERPVLRAVQLEERREVSPVRRYAAGVGAAILLALLVLLAGWLWHL